MRRRIPRETLVLPDEAILQSSVFCHTDIIVQQRATIDDCVFYDSQIAFKLKPDVKYNPNDISVTNCTFIDPKV
jgi:hypothetical protein